MKYLVIDADNNSAYYDEKPQLEDGQRLFVQIGDTDKYEEVIDYDNEK